MSDGWCRYEVLSSWEVIQAEPWFLSLVTRDNYCKIDHLPEVLKQINCSVPIAGREWGLNGKWRMGRPAHNLAWWSIHTGTMLMCYWYSASQFSPHCRSGSDSLEQSWALQRQMKRKIEVMLYYKFMISSAWPREMFCDGIYGWELLPSQLYIWSLLLEVGSEGP